MDKTRNGLVCLVDWLQFTVKTLDLIGIYDLLGIPETEFTNMPTGLYNYRRRKSCGHIWIMYEGNNADMGIHVQISGQGCREYESFYDGDWFELFAKLRKLEANITRFDLAIDDIRYNGDKPYFTIRKLLRKISRGEIASKWRTGRRMNKLELNTGKSKGDTLYLGSDSSMIQLTIYEKDKEREANEVELEEGLTSWNRSELHLYDDRAYDAIGFILMGMSAGEVFQGIVRQYVRFLDRDPDNQNKARWNESEFWLQFLNEADKIQLARKAPDKTIEKKRAWLDKQVQKTFAQVYVAEGMPDIDKIAEWINDGMQLMNEYDWALAEDHKVRIELLKKLEEQRKLIKIDNYLEKQQDQLDKFRQKKRDALQSAPNIQ